MARQEPIDIKTLRYVLYVRRSTSDGESQIRSLPDQIRDCKKRASELGLNVIETLKESKSAKKPNQRPIFNQMINDLEKKRFDAILCWHPDRLCRNMLEGGQIINMLDDGVLKDICFYSHQFSNDANGKMLLGMLFVFSKQYSDGLSDKVNRGNEGNFLDGKSVGSPKWGYTRSDIDGYYERNQYYNLIKEAWRRRGNGETCEVLAQYLVENDCHRITKLNKKNKRIRRINPSLGSMYKMFRDPFYYGVLQQAKQTTYLPEIYNFEPMIEEDLYNKVQAIAKYNNRDVAPKKQQEFKPLVRLVYCGVCNSNRWMVAGKNKMGNGRHVLSYRCDNPDCKRTTKSIRAHYVFDGIISLLERLDVTDEAYERYGERIGYYTDEKIVAIKTDISSMNGSLSHKKNYLEALSLGLGNIDKKSAAYAINVDTIARVSDECGDLETKIAKLEAKIANPNIIKLTKEEFLNLLKLAPNKMRAGNVYEKDAIARKLFLNLYLDDKKALSVIWREPFASLVKAIEMSFGTRERT